jgi:pilus assembly protein FimV
VWAPPAATPATLELDAGAELTFLPVDAPAATPEPEGAALALLDVEDVVELEPVVEAAPAAVPAPASVTTPVVAPAAPTAASSTDGEYVDLGDWLRETEEPRSSRMVTAEPSQTGDEEADFQRMLDAFKAGVERNIEDEDFDSHYDLGVAFREMGLLEEATTQFQRASRAPGRPLRAIEALGECLIELGHPELALEALRRGIEDGTGEASPLPDQQLVGVIYLLGMASEQTQRSDAASAYYRRVLATDLQFRDAARRLAQLSAPPR